jgi:hypothetical protein
VSAARPFPASPLVEITERSSKRFAIKKRILPAGVPVDVISMRQAFLTGTKVVTWTPRRPLAVHDLVAKDTRGVLMSDHPQELIAMGAFARRASGAVLIGGLGLGIVARYARARKRVTTIDVIEREREIVDLVGPIEGVDVHVADLFKFLRDVKRWVWDSAFFDIWSPTNEATWVEYIGPLRRLVAQRFGAQRVWCWGEDEIKGQMFSALAGRSCFPVDASSWAAPHHAFRAATLDRWPPIVKDWPPLGGFGPEQSADVARMTMERMRDPEFMMDVRAFLEFPGNPIWEKRFGGHWDSWEKGA